MGEERHKQARIRWTQRGLERVWTFGTCSREQKLDGTIFFSAHTAANHKIALLPLSSRRIAFSCRNPLTSISSKQICLRRYRAIYMHKLYVSVWLPVFCTLTVRRRTTIIFSVFPTQSVDTGTLISPHAFFSLPHFIHADTVFISFLCNIICSLFFLLFCVLGGFFYVL